MAKVSLEKDKIKFLLVEGVHQKAIDSLRAAGYTNIEFHKGALDSEQLKASIRRGGKTGCRRLLLHRYQPGRSGRRREARYSGV